MATEIQINEAKEKLAYYTLAASFTGAVPVPAASAAIIAQNGIMLAHIASALGAQITTATVIESLGVTGTLNVAGRTLFIEGAKLLSWGVGGPFAAALLSGLGASTAGVQTYMIGTIAIEIGKNGGKSLSSSMTSKIIDQTKESYDTFIAEWKEKDIKKPGDLDPV